MRYLKLMALGVLAMGFSARAALKTEVAYQGSHLDYLSNDRYGMGINGGVAAEHPMMGANSVGGLGLRANFDNYRVQGGGVNNDIQEGGVALTGALGPNTLTFQPRIGGHVGYARMEDANFFDLGPDVSAALKVTPRLGIQAMVTPTWFMNQNRTDYQGTKLGLGVVWSTPGA
jgi:hypothetical protein